MSSERVNLLGLPRAQLETFVAARLGAKPFRARQLMKWIYRRGAADFSSMTDLAQEFRAQLIVHEQTRDLFLVHVCADRSQVRAHDLPDQYIRVG